MADINWYGWEEQLYLPLLIKKQRIDLMHFPHFNVPLFYPDPFVVTIHDLIMHHYPRPQATTRSKPIYWLKDKMHRLIIKQAVKKAKTIIVPTNFTGQDIIKTLRLNSHLAQKIKTTYLGVAESIQSQPDNKIFSKCQINLPFVLYAGNAYPHKNLERLIKAWKIFIKTNQSYQLVLAGSTNYFYRQLMNQEKNWSSFNIVFTDFVKDNELCALYQQAELFVFPSLYEGFGLPPLEAIQHGLPVACSNTSCLPEILGDGAIYFDPKNEEQIAQTINLALHDKSLRQRLIDAGQQQLKNYSWQKTAQKTLEIYK